jgi:hypothetical protein
MHMQWMNIAGQLLIMAGGLTVWIAVWTGLPA